MKFYWSKEKSELHDIIQRECVKWFFKGQSSFGGDLDAIFKFLNEKKEKALWVVFANNIINAIGKSKLGCPFEHVNEKELEKVFLK